MNTNRELSIKSKLLFNNLDMHLKIILDLNKKVEKRIKSLDVIFQIYRMTLNPFIKTESDEYQKQININIDSKYNKIIEMINNFTTVETLNFYLSPIVNHLKDMISTCKVKLDYLEKIWKD